MNRYDVEAWTCFLLFVIAIAVASALAGVGGICVVVVLTLGILDWADRRGYLKKDAVKKPEHDYEKDGGGDDDA